MGKGSGRRKQDITDKELEEAWNRIFSGQMKMTMLESERKKYHLKKMVMMMVMGTL